MAAWIKPILVTRAIELKSGDTMLVYLPSGIHHHGIASVTLSDENLGNIVVEFLSAKTLEFHPDALVLVVN